MESAVPYLFVFFGVLTAAAWPLGALGAAALGGRRTFLSPVLDPVERLLLRLAGPSASGGMDWRRYTLAVVLFNAAGCLLVYAIVRLQALLPLNPAGFGGLAPHTALNIAVSFASNTNWQNYGGESTLGYFAQMVALGVQNFVSAATGIAVMAALARGFARCETRDLGNFWRDLVRSTLHLLLPLSVVVAVALVWQGVPQTLSPYAGATTLEGATQTIAVGPAASQVAIKQLGTNGGGFFNANSAHPLENPTPLTNFLELLAILLVPAALCHTFGRMVGDRRQGWMLLGVMTAILVVAAAVTIAAESAGNPELHRIGVSGANWEGKELRHGIASSALWSVATTAASNGSVNAMHDSFMPLSGMVQLVLMQLGEVVFGGVGSGLYGMILFVIVAVFAAGLMVGRTPEYLGKKIGPHEMKLATLGVLAPSVLILLATSVGVLAAQGLAGRSNPGPHGFSQILYAFTSQGANNGSAFAGYGANVPLVNYVGAACMWLGRFIPIVVVMGIAGSLASRKFTPPGAGTLPTHTPLFAVLLASVVLIIGALTFLPSLALGPIVEHLLVR